MQYINRRGLPVTVTITYHARERFFQRWHQLHGKALLPHNFRAEIEKQFSAATLEKRPLSKKDKRRAKRRAKRLGDDALVFHNDKFTFIVKNAHLITVKINKCHPTPVLPAP